MDRGAWWAVVHGVANSRTQLSNFTFAFHFHALEKEMATHSSVLAWRIPGTGEPGGLPSMGSHRVRHNWSNLAATAAEGISWRRQWHPTPVFLPEKSHGWRRLLGCSPWGCEESDTTKRLHFHFSLSCVEEGNGNPLQCPCLENPRDGGAWWVTIYGVAQSQTQLKQLSSNSSRGNIFNNYEQFAYSYLLIEFKCHVIKMNQSTWFSIIRVCISTF